MFYTLSCFLLVTFLLFLLQHGDIESNPGPEKEQIKSISCCHWNVHSLLAQNMCKISQIEAYNSLYNYDFLCISETYFDYSVLQGHINSQLNGYQRIRADHLVDISAHLVELSNLCQISIVKDILVLSTGLQAKTILNMKIFCLTLMSF